MGWLTWQHETRDTDSTLRAECTWTQHDATTGDRHTYLATALVGTTWYAAVEHVKASGERKVFALIFLTNRRGGGFGYKDMDESMGPCQATCPKRILDLLTPVEAGSSYAADWRRRCAEHAAAKARLSKTRRQISVGDRVVFAEPLRYGGQELQDFTIVPTPRGHRGLIAAPTGGHGLYRLPQRHLATATVTRGA